MKKKNIIGIVCLTLAVAITLSVYVVSTIRSVNENVTQSCFNQLADTSVQLAEELYKITDMDHTVLTAMSAIIENADSADNDELCRIMRSYDHSASYVSYVELLRPDNTMLDSDGTVRDVSDFFDFSSEARRGEYISGISKSTLDHSERVVRNAVPVKKNGQTIYMLYGVVRLSEFVQNYRTNIYGGHAYVYLEDGDSGDFLLDTWHKSFGNIQDFKQREMLSGYSFDKAIFDMSSGVGGNLGFVSKTTGNILYMHYEPVGVNNWNVIITVEQGYALQESETISTSLYRMAAVLGVVILAYMMFILSCLFRAYRRVHRLGMEDQTTKLRNRNSYDAYIADCQNIKYDSISCIFVDANGLHEVNNHFGHQVGDQMLLLIAEALKREFPGEAVFRIGGDEFVVFSKDDSLDVCREKMEKAKAQIKKRDYSISYGIACRQGEMGVNRVVREADQKMLEDKKDYYIRHNRRRGSEEDS